MIRQIHIQNYKALRDVTLDLTPFHVLIGPNDSGKTSILQAIAGLCKLVELEDQQHEWWKAFDGAWQGNELVWNRSPKGEVVFTAACENGTSFEYKVACVFAPSGQQISQRHEVISGFGNRTDLARTRMQNVIQQWINRKNGQAFRGNEPELAAYRSALGRARYCHFIPRHLALPVALESGLKFDIKPSGFGLALCIDDILGSDTQAFAALSARLREMFPQIKSIKLLREAGYATGPNFEDASSMSAGKRLYFEFENVTQPVPASQVSDGILLILAYLTVLHLPEPPRVLLIEEPETGIYPRLLRDVVKILRNLIASQSHTQVVMTTHSPDLLDAFAPDEVSLCKKEHDGSVSVHRLSNSKTVKEQLDIFSLGEIWTAETEDALIAPVEEPAK
jgi:predicted ATPase